MIAVVFASSLIICFLCLQSLLLGHRNCCVCNVTVFIKTVSDHYSVDFLGKERVF